MVQRPTSLTRDTSGSTAIEYALIAALIAVTIIATLNVLFNDNVNGLYSSTVLKILNAFGS